MATMTGHEFFLDELRRRRNEYAQAARQLAAEQQRVSDELRRVTELFTHVDALIKAEEPEPKERASKPLLELADWAGLSINDALQRVLGESERPMHANELVEALRSHGVPLSQKDPLATVVTALVRGTQRGIYARTAPNTFRLTKEPGVPETLMTKRQIEQELGGSST